MQPGAEPRAVGSPRVTFACGREGGGEKSTKANCTSWDGWGRPSGTEKANSSDPQQPKRGVGCRHPCTQAPKFSSRSPSRAAELPLREGTRGGACAAGPAPCMGLCGEKAALRGREKGCWGGDNPQEPQNSDVDQLLEHLPCCPSPRAAQSGCGGEAQGPQTAPNSHASPA